jgi:hypothetical protein
VLGIRTLALSAALALLSIPSRAEAQEGGVQTHDGFYLRLGIGPALIFGSVEATELAQPPDVGISGFGLGTELAVGGTPIPGLVLGGGSFGTAIFRPTYEDDSNSLKGGLLVMSAIGPFADYYLDPNGGLHFQAAIAFATVSQAAGEEGESGELTEASGGEGFAFLLGAGYEIWIGEQWSLGALARITYYGASLEGDETELEYDFSAFVPALLATFTYH